MPNVKRLGVLDFNPRAPCGARLYQSDTCQEHNVFQSTRPLRGATCSFFCCQQSAFISIHAPLAGRDARTRSTLVLSSHFNPRAPCGARRQGQNHEDHRLRHFNPRAPCGARPGGRAVMQEDVAFQSTRPLRGATLNRQGLFFRLRISIHAPLAGRDLIPCLASFCAVHISIHAPLAGRDFPRAIRRTVFYYFNPRAPCGARPPITRPRSGIARFQSTRPLRGATPQTRHSVFFLLFQSTRPLRGATKGQHGLTMSDCISIHAPLAGRDLASKGTITKRRYFNPRAPCGARPVGIQCRGLQTAISIHAPLAGRDNGVQGGKLGVLISIHAPLAGRDCGLLVGFLVDFTISIHAPLAGRDIQAVV